MKIAIFHNLPSGGAKRTLFEQVKGLANNHQVDVYSLATADSDFLDVSKYARVISVPFQPLQLFKQPFRRLNQINRSLDIIRLRSLERKLADRIDNDKYDVVLVHPCQFTISPALIQFLNTPVVYYSQDVNRYLYDPNIKRPYFKRQSMRAYFDRVDPLPKIYYWLMDRDDRLSRLSCDVYLTNSYFIRESSIRIYGRAPSVCYHGVDTNLFKPLTLERKYQVLSVGSVTPNKGYDFIIQSLSTIPDNQRPPLIIVANSENLDEKLYLEQLATNLGVDVRFTTLITDESLIHQYEESTLTVYAPIMESFGLVPLESMACGTPVVGIAEGGIRETIQHGVNGLLIDRDPVLFGEAILHLLNHDKFAQRLGTQGRDIVVKNWNWEKAINTLERYLRIAISQ